MTDIGIMTRTYGQTIKVHTARFLAVCMLFISSCSAQMKAQKVARSHSESVPVTDSNPTAISFSIDAPESANANEPIVVHWEAVIGAVSYALLVASDQTCKTVVFSIQKLTTVTQTIVLNNAGTYFICVVAEGKDGDQKNAKNSGVQIVIAGNQNTLPLANAGADQNVNETAPVTLDGTASTDSENQALTYSWIQTSGTSVTLSSATAAQPTFTTPSLLISETLVFSLVVNDGAQNSIADTVSINVTATNNAPTANAGVDQSVSEITLVTLNGTASSDSEGQSLTYSWSQTSGTAVSLSSTTAAQPTFTAPNKTSNYTLVFSLVVNDGSQNSAADSIAINVIASNDAPSANAAADQNVNENVVVTLNGSASSDPEGQSLTYSWSQTSGPAVSLSSTTVAQPTFTALNKASNYTLVFSLVVNDGSQNSSADSVTINVTAPDDPPVAVADMGIVVQDSNIIISVVANDTDADTAAGSLSVAAITQGAHGTVVDNADKTVTYTSANGFTGIDTFTYDVTDGTSTRTGTVTVYVYPTPTAFTWTGATNSNWNTAGNWFGGVAPGLNDVALFSARCGLTCPVTVNTAISIKGASLHSTFLGSITQGAGNTMTIGMSGWTQAGGTFTGGSSAIALNGLFSQTGGTFTSTSGTLGMDFSNFGNTNQIVFTLGASATFAHNNGMLFMYRGCGQGTWDEFALGQTLELYDFAVIGGSACMYVYLPAAQTINVNHNFTQSGHYLAVDGTFNLYGDLTVASGAGGGYGGSINLLGSANQSYTYTGGYAPGIKVDKSSSSFSPAGGTTALAISGIFEIASGEFIAPSGVFTIDPTVFGNVNKDLFTLSASGIYTHNSGTLNLTRTGGQWIYGSLVLGQTLELYNLQLSGNGAMVVYLPSAKTVNINNNFSQQGLMLSGSGAFNLKGNLAVSASASGGDAVIEFNGSGNQTYAYTAGAAPSIKINKTLGSVAPAGGTTSFAISIFELASGSFTAPSGLFTLSPVVYGNATVFTVANGTTFNHGSGTVKFYIHQGAAGYFTGLSLGQTLDLYNLIVDVTGGQGGYYFDVPNGQTLNVNGNLTTTYGGLSGTFNLYGDFTEENTTSSTVAAINFLGTGTQHWTRGTSAVGTQGAVTVNKAFGSLILSSNINLSAAGQDLTVTSGSLNLGGFTLTVNDYLTIGAAGTLTVSGGSYSPNAGAKFVNNGIVN